MLLSLFALPSHGLEAPRSIFRHLETPLRGTTHNIGHGKFPRLWGSSTAIALVDAPGHFKVD